VQKQRIAVEQPWRRSRSYVCPRRPRVVVTTPTSSVRQVSGRGSALGCRRLCPACRNDHLVVRLGQPLSCALAPEASREPPCLREIAQ